MTPTRWAVVLCLLACAASAQRLDRLQQRLDRRDRLGGTSTVLYRYDSAVASAFSVANPVPAGTTAWCETVTLVYQSDWTSGSADQRAALHSGDIYGTANTFEMFRLSNRIDARIYNSSGAATVAFGSVVYTNRLRSPEHRVSICKVPGAVYAFLDGAQGATATVATDTYVQPGNLWVGKRGNTAPYTYGAGIKDVCVSGPIPGATGTTPQQLVRNDCGQFTVRDPGPCVGCVTPDAGAVKVAALGDSITEKCQDVSRTYPQRLNALLGTSWDVVNWGASGFKVAAVRSQYQIRAKGKGYTHAVVMAGVNNIGRDGETAAATWTAMQGLLDEIRADGLKLIVGTITQFNVSTLGWWTAAKQTEADAYNDSIRAYCVTYPDVTCVDAFEGMKDLVDRTTLKAEWKGDGVHPSQAGCDQLASLFHASWPVPP